MNVAIIGTKHIGLRLGALFAEFGHGTVCIDGDNLESGIKSADIAIIAFDTPNDIYAAAAALTPYLTGYTVIANKSNATVGTGDKIAEIIKSGNLATDAVFDVIAMPESTGDKIIIGTTTERAKNVILKLYNTFPNNPNIEFVSRHSAEANTICTESGK